MIKGGKGGSKTLSGLVFEERTDLKSIFGKLPNYKIKGNDLLFENKAIAQIFKKGEFYSKFLSKLKINSDEILSKKLIPDSALFVLNKNTLFIIEMKFQEVEGSVDEKLQTCDFKKKQYQRLLSTSGINVEYVYVLNDWFNRESYKDVLNYIKSVGCHYFFKEIPLEFLGLSH